MKADVTVFQPKYYCLKDDGRNSYAIVDMKNDDGPKTLIEMTESEMIALLDSMQSWAKYIFSKELL